jgi:hypothetical protein
MGYTRQTRFQCNANDCGRQIVTYMVPHWAALAHAAEYGWVFKLNGALSFCPEHKLKAEREPD